MSFAYFFVFPVAFGFFAGYTPAGVQMMTDIDKYLSFVLTMFIAFGLTFETPVVVIVLVRMRVVSLEKLQVDAPVRDRRRVRHRRDLHAAGRDLAAACSPIPLWLLYELGLQLARFVAVPVADADATRREDNRTSEVAAAYGRFEPRALRDDDVDVERLAVANDLDPARSSPAGARRSARAAAARRGVGLPPISRRRRAPGCRRGRPDRRAATPRTSTPSVRASASACAASRVIACGSTPSQPRVTSPSLMICSSTCARATPESRSRCPSSRPTARRSCC